MKRNPEFKYIVQPGDNLYLIAMKFQTSVESIVSLNHLVSPFIYIGQTLLIPEPASKKGIEVRQLQYKPVTAYTADRPILVNGVDINTGLYPVLNFQPAGATYPYIYVPIAEFSRVGARVVWDETNQVIRVTSDYDELKNRVNVLTQENQYLLSLTEDLSMEGLGNTAGNILNSGIVGKEIEWIYYNKRQGTAFYAVGSSLLTSIITCVVTPNFWAIFQSVSPDTTV
jgi:spore germination protein YaaH